MDLAERFEAVNDEFLKFDRVKEKRNNRPDLHAYLLIDELFPAPGRAMVRSAGHDEIWLEADLEQWPILTEAHILELVRCGVRYDDESDCLSMYV